MKIEIYKITCLINKKVYVGQTLNLNERWVNHCSISSRTHISNAIRKYGKDNFAVEVIGICWSRKEADRIEKEFIRIYRRKGEMYNQSEGGDGGIGFKHSEETKQKMSETRKGRVITWGDKITIANTGRVMSQESRDKISLFQRGRKRSPEFVEKMRNTLKGRVITWGDKISKSLLGRPVSQEVRNKIAVSLRGKTQSQETKDKKSESLRQSWAASRKPLVYKLLGQVPYEI